MERKRWSADITQFARKTFSQCRITKSGALIDIVDENSPVMQLGAISHSQGVCKQIRFKCLKSQIVFLIRIPAVDRCGFQCGVRQMVYAHTS